MRPSAQTEVVVAEAGITNFLSVCGNVTILLIFYGMEALNNVIFCVVEVEIHCIVSENGFLF